MRLKKQLFSVKSLLLYSFILGYSLPLYAEELTPGLRYEKKSTQNGTIIHILEMDPQYFDISIANAKPSDFGRETVANIAKQAKASAAVNGGFFLMGETSDGLPAGILKINGQWQSIAYHPRGAIGWSKNLKTVLMDRLQTKTTITINDFKFPLHIMNQPAVGNQAALYTPFFASFLHSKREGYDVVILDNQVVDLNLNESTDIPKNGFLYSIGPKIKAGYPQIHLGDHFQMNITLLPQLHLENQAAWETCDFILGGAPLLISKGQQIADYSAEHTTNSFINERHARTAIGLLSNQKMIFVVAEFNPFQENTGLTIPELAELMIKQNCTDALNLDGGGSSTLYFKNQILNHITGDKDEGLGLNLSRAVSNAVVILPKQQNPKA